MPNLNTCSLPGAAIYGTSTRRFEVVHDFNNLKTITSHLNGRFLLKQQCEFTSTANLRQVCQARKMWVQQKSVRCNATQTQSVQRKSSSATIQRDKKGKVQGPKLDDGSGGFPPFRFGKGGGGGGGGGGGSNYFGGFLLFTCVLLLDYLKEFEKYLVTRRHRAGDDASHGLLPE
ncbi:hypothetical protein ACP70R_029229 [Stipagrostis hirtigluma subsp. patula]